MSKSEDKTEPVDVATRELTAQDWSPKTREEWQGIVLDAQESTANAFDRAYKSIKPAKKDK